jgi:hypothetical protein
MRIRETHLRRVIRDELRGQSLKEQRAVGTGGGLSGYTPQQKNQIADKVRNELEKRLLASGVLLPGDTWAITLNIGLHGINVGKKSGAMEGVRDREIRPHLRAIANNRSIIDRKNLRFGRRLKLSLSNTAAKAEEVPDKGQQGGKVVPRAPRKPSPYERGDKCVKLQQVELDVTADGIWGPRTQAAWDAAHPGVALPADSKDLPACKKGEPDDEECPEGEEWPGPPMAPDVCEPIEDEEDADEDAGPTKECIIKGEEIIKFLRGVDNPLAQPQFYSDISKSPEKMQVFASMFGRDRAEFTAEMKETLGIMERIYKCDCKGPTGHTEAAEELILQIRTNADNFGDMFDPMQLFWRIRRMGVRAFFNAFAGLWNFFDWTNYFGTIPKIENITWSRAGMTGWIPGFDPLGRSDEARLLELAAELDALDICGPAGEEFGEKVAGDVSVEIEDKGPALPESGW